MSAAMESERLLRFDLDRIMARTRRRMPRPGETHRLGELDVAIRELRAFERAWLRYEVEVAPTLGDARPLELVKLQAEELDAASLTRRCLDPHDLEKIHKLWPEWETRTAEATQHIRSHSEGGSAGARP